MDGLSGAASGMAVFSLALQLGHNIKRLYDFWDSIEEAPDYIRSITTELSLLSGVLIKIASEEQHFEPDQTLITALEACRNTIQTLTYMTNVLEPGFTSRSLRTRKWTAFKAVMKAEKIQRFQQALNGLKINLMLAQQSHQGSLNRIQHQNQKQDLTAIIKVLSSLKPERMSASVTTVSSSSSVPNEHTDTLRAETSRICRSIPNPIQCVDFELGSDIAIEDLASSLSTGQSTTPRLLANVQTNHSTYPRPAQIIPRFRQQTVTKYILTMRESIKQTFFGTITTTTRTRVLRSRFVHNDTSDDKEYQYEHESSVRILPAQWLLKLGFNYAYNFSTQDSSTQGWQWSLKPINLVPDNAPIFKFCEQGNIEKVRDLISRKVASVRDVDSWSKTALHYAVRGHNPELCKLLIEAGADKNARDWIGRSPLTKIYQRTHHNYGEVRAIDTCRIFEDSFDFWDENGDAWYILEQISCGNPIFIDLSAEERLVFLSWFINLSSLDIKANYFTSNVRRVMWNAHDILVDAVGLLLKLDPPVDEFEQSLPAKDYLFFGSVANQKWTYVSILLGLGANPHQVYFDEHHNPITESPLSQAMYSSWTFWAFRNALHGTNLDVEDFVREELKEGRPLLEAGWQMETLRTLLELKFAPKLDRQSRWRSHLWKSFGSSNHFDCCSRRILDNRNVPIEIPVQPYWQGILQQIKNGTYQQSIYSDTQGEYRLSIRFKCSKKDNLINATNGSTISQDPALLEIEATQPDEVFSSKQDTSSILVRREDVWCIRCWYRFRETGRRPSPAISKTQSSNGNDSSEDEFSPYLFKT